MDAVTVSAHLTNPIQLSAAEGEKQIHPELWRPEEHFTFEIDQRECEFSNTLGIDFTIYFIYPVALPQEEQGVTFFRSKILSPYKQKIDHIHIRFDLGYFISDKIVLTSTKYTAKINK